MPRPQRPNPGPNKHNRSTKRPNRGMHKQGGAKQFSRSSVKSSARPNNSRKPGNKPHNANPAVVIPPGAKVHRIGSEHGIDLAHFISEFATSGHSVRSIRRILDKGCCWVNGRIETFGSRKLYRGDVVAILLPGSPGSPNSSATWQLERKRFIAIEDDIIVYDKPAGMPVTPTDAGKTVNLLELLQQRYSKDIQAVHRLDRDTSGVVIFARNSATQNQLDEVFREHQVQKTYLALVRGVPRASGERSTYLKLLERGKGWERWGTGRGQGALQAHTTWKIKETYNELGSLVTVTPKTGRTHQIRVHFSEMEHPLFGDRIYGDRQDPIAVSRHMLHASMMKITIDNKNRTFRANLPDDLKQAIASIKQEQ